MCPPINKPRVNVNPCRKQHQSCASASSSEYVVDLQSQARPSCGVQRNAPETCTYQVGSEHPVNQQDRAGLSCQAPRGSPERCKFPPETKQLAPTNDYPNPVKRPTSMSTANTAISKRPHQENFFKEKRLRERSPSATRYRQHN